MADDQQQGRVVYVTRYDVIVHASNRHAGLGKPVTVYADTRQAAVNKAVAVGWSGRADDARVTFQKVTQEVVVIPPAPSCERDIPPVVHADAAEATA